MKSSLEIKELGIVLVGHFNPIIYHPQWMTRKDIINPQEAEAANIRINHPEVTEFELDYCSIQIVKNRFTASSTQETHFKALRDIVWNIFDRLPECPVSQVGINLHHHYRFQEKLEYINFGHKIVPKEHLWNNFLSDPGVSNVAIQGKREDEHNGYKVIHMTISNKIRPYGVQIYLNDHYQLFSQGEDEKLDSHMAIKLLETTFDTSLEQSGKIIKGIYEYGSA